MSYQGVEDKSETDPVVDVDTGGSDEYAIDPSYGSSAAPRSSVGFQSAGEPFSFKSPRSALRYVELVSHMGGGAV